MPAISSVLTGCVNNTKANDNNDTLTYAKLLKTIPPNVRNAINRILVLRD